MSSRPDLAEHTILCEEGNAARFGVDNLPISVNSADSHRKFCDLITASSMGGMVEDDLDGDFLGCA